jgi:hypothetical protein
MVRGGRLVKSQIVVVEDVGRRHHVVKMLRGLYERRPWLRGKIRQRMSEEVAMRLHVTIEDDYDSVARRRALRRAALPTRTRRRRSLVNTEEQHRRSSGGGGGGAGGGRSRAERGARARTG